MPQLPEASGPGGRVFRAIAELDEQDGRRDVRRARGGVVVVEGEDRARGNGVPVERLRRHEANEGGVRGIVDDHPEAACGGNRGEKKGIVPE